MSGFHEVQFPTDISWGSVGGPQFKTSVMTLPSGAEERVELWSGGRLSYNARYGVKTASQLAALQAFFRARRGAAYGFRFKDFLDFHSSPSNPTYVEAGVEGHGPGDQDQEIGVGDGTTTVFQLKKTYVSALNTQVRTIFKPVAGSVRIWVNGVEATTGWTVDTTTGQVTFSAAPTAGHVVEASFEFDVPVRFSEESGEVLHASIDQFDSGDAPDVPLIEVLDPSSGYENEFFYGGSLDLAIDANRTLSVGEAFTYRVTAASAGLRVILPAEESTPDGRAVFMIINDGANSFDVYTDAPASLVTLAAGAAALCSVVITTAGGARTWMAV